MSKTILTRDGRQKMQEELNFLRGSETRRLLDALSDSRRDNRDVSENSEYAIAKQQLEMLQSKIMKMEETISNSVIIDSSNIDTSSVSVLTTVKVKNKKNKQEMKFTIVPENEIDLKTGKISLNSPIGKGLIGKKVKEIAQIQTPGGLLELEIMEITV
jgi:transcription elongation factor GreA